MLQNPLKVTVWVNIERGEAHQKSRCVDVNRLNNCKLPLDFPDGVPRPVKLDFDPVTNATMFSFEGRDQSLFWKLETERKLVSSRRKDSHFTVIWEETQKKKILSHVVKFII